MTVVVQCQCSVQLSVMVLAVKTRVKFVNSDRGWSVVSFVPSILSQICAGPV